MSRTTDLPRGAAPVSVPRSGEGVLAGTEDEAQIDEEMLIEEISIDGMCGVY